MRKFDIVEGGLKWSKVNGLIILMIKFNQIFQSSINSTRKQMFIEIGFIVKCLPASRVDQRIKLL